MIESIPTSRYLHGAQESQKEFKETHAFGSYVARSRSSFSDSCLDCSAICCRFRLIGGRSRIALTRRTTASLRGRSCLSSRFVADEVGPFGADIMPEL